MKTYLKIYKSLVTAFFVGTLLIAFTFSNNISAQTEKKTSSEYTPMYEDQTYSNKSLDPSSNTMNQDQANQKSLQAPPPGEPDPGNQVPVPSSIIPLLAMALGLTLWRIHKSARKTRKAD